MKSEENTESGRLEFASTILARLGEELNASVEHGIIELAKNSYDADARQCLIKLVNISKAGGTIIIEDNGDGMTTEAIKHNWLVLGKSSKDRAELTRLGRIPVGNKGLGRLAALRLGRQANLITRHISSPETEHQVELDWPTFDKADIVGNVKVPVQTRQKPGGSKGTVIHLRNLREKIGRMAIKRLARALLLLSDPFGDDPSSFQPTLQAPEFEDLEHLVHASYFSEAEYHLAASINSSGHASAELRDWRGSILFRASHKDITRRRKNFQNQYPCPPSKFDLWAFLMTAKDFSTRTATLGEVKEWLKNFGGVHLYQDGIRVSPYGDPGSDWLDMNLARARDPELRPSTNTSIGRLRVEGDDQLLIQKTDRTGYIETPAFQALRFFCQDALDWMQAKRLEIREKKRTKTRIEVKEAATRESRGVRDAINSLPAGQSQSSLSVAFEKYEHARKKQIQKLSEEVQLYRTLATAGIAAATFAHESDGGSLKRIGVSLNSLEYRAKKHLETEIYQRHFKKLFDQIRSAADSLGVLGKATLRMVEHQKRRSGKVLVNTVIREVFDTLGPFLKARGIATTLKLSGPEPFLLGSQAAVESIVTNLLNNSATAFESIQRDNRRIVVKTVLSDNMDMTIDFMDNGTGIIGIDPKDIWLPGKTTRQSGTGLGLTIVRDATIDLSGQVSVEPEGELGGATFQITLPIQGIDHV